MATRKRNEWLDAEDSDDERGYASEEESRARMLPSSKRRKVEHDSADEDDIEDDSNVEEEHEERGESGQITHTNLKHKSSKDGTSDSELSRLEKLAANLPTSLQPKTALTAPLSLPTTLKKDKSGIIYLSRCPPFMKPAVLRSLLTPYGAIGRIFLTPESTTSRSSRLKSGGTRRKLFLDGWVEFLSKKDAKFVTENLNAQTMGGKKRGRWHDEVWNIKYLSGVKWSHLVEQIQNENAERAARMRSEIAKGKGENKAFLENIERGKMIDGIKEKRRKKEEEDENEDGAKAIKKEREKGPRREFKQNEVRRKGEKKTEPGQEASKSKVLKSIF